MAKEMNFIECKHMLASRTIKDKALRERILHNPEKELTKELGAPSKYGAKSYKLVENTKDKIYLVLPNATVIKTLSYPKEINNFNSLYLATIINVSKDPALRKKYLANPKEMLQANTKFSMILPANVTLEILEDNDQVINFVLPAMSPTGALTDEQLASVAGGKGKG